MRIRDVQTILNKDRNFPIENVELNISLMLEKDEESIIFEVFGSQRYDTKKLLNALLKMEARKYIDKKSLDSLDIMDLLKYRYPQYFI